MKPLANALAGLALLALAAVVLMLAALCLSPIP